MSSVESNADKQLQRPIQREVGYREAFKKFWTQWTPRGRSSRSEMCFAGTMNGILWIPYYVLNVLSTPFTYAFYTEEEMILIYQLVAGVFWWLPILAGFYPSICLLVRRLHDTGRSGWRLLLAFFIIPIPWITWWIHLPSEPRTNRYGAIPNVVE